MNGDIIISREQRAMTPEDERLAQRMLKAYTIQQFVVAGVVAWSVLCLLPIYAWGLHQQMPLWQLGGIILIVVVVTAGAIWAL